MYDYSNEILLGRLHMTKNYNQSRYYYFSHVRPVLNNFTIIVMLGLNETVFLLLL